MGLEDLRYVVWDEWVQDIVIVTVQLLVTLLLLVVIVVTANLKKMKVGMAETPWEAAVSWHSSTSTYKNNNINNNNNNNLNNNNTKKLQVKINNKIMVTVKTITKATKTVTTKINTIQ